MTAGAILVLLSARRLLQSARMRALLVYIVMAMAAGAAWGNELAFDFSRYPADKTPPGWTNLLFGGGGKGEWKVILDEVPTQFPPLTDRALSVSKKAVLAQLSTDPTDERYPMLAYDLEVFKDFTLTTKFKTVAGEKERMAGLAFRLQDEKNFYVIRASSLGNSLRFYKVVNGERQNYLGPEIAIPSGVWHELTLTCKGNYITCLLNGQPAMPQITDYSFTKGKIAFWTKSDSVSYFTETKVNFTPSEPLAAVLVRDTIKKYPRIEELTLFVKESNGFIRALASSRLARVGDGAGKAEQDVIEKGVIYTGKTRQSVTVTMPLHDRNGETVAAVGVVMKAFPGQTEQNAIARAMPIVKQMEVRVRNREDLGP